jgi:hypothetical protein
VDGHKIIGGHEDEGPFGQLLGPREGLNMVEAGHKNRSWEFSLR